MNAYTSPVYTLSTPSDICIHTSLMYTLLLSQAQPHPSPSQALDTYPIRHSLLRYSLIPRLFLICGKRNNEPGDETITSTCYIYAYPWPFSPHMQSPILFIYNKHINPHSLGLSLVRLPPPHPQPPCTTIPTTTTTLISLHSSVLGGLSGVVSRKTQRDTMRHIRKR